MRLRRDGDVKVDWSRSLMPPLAKPGSPGLRWHQWFTRVETVFGFVLLVVPVLLTTLPANQTADHRAVTLALAGGAAVWLLLTTVLPHPGIRERPVFAVLTFVGVVSFATALQARDSSFSSS